MSNEPETITPTTFVGREVLGQLLLNARKAAGLSRDAVINRATSGFSRSSLQAWEAGEREPSLENLFDLAVIYGTSPWALVSHAAPSLTPKTEASNDDYYYIPAYEIEASAGHGAFTEGAATPAKHLAFRKDWMHDRRLSPSSLSAIFTRGDSMEPTIPDGATILVDGSRIEALDGKIYVIRIDDRLWVKRVQWIPSGGLRLISDNRTYDSFDISKADLEHDDIQICGQVVNVSYDFPE